MSLTDEPFIEKALRQATGLHNLVVTTNPDDQYKIDVTLNAIDYQALLDADQQSLEDAQDAGYENGREDGVGEARAAIYGDLVEGCYQIRDGEKTLVEVFRALCLSLDVRNEVIAHAIIAHAALTGDVEGVA